VLWSCAGLVAVGALLTPLAWVQRHGAQRNWIHELPRDTRLEDVLRHPLAGELGGPVHGFVQAAFVLALVAIALLLVRGTARARRGALVASGIVVGSLALPFLPSFVPSLDFFFARNSLAVVVPMLIVVAAGLAVPRGGWIAGVTLVVLCTLWMVINVAVPLDKKLQRDDWRGAVDSLGPVTQPRVVATAPVFHRLPLDTYLDRATRIGPAGAVASELDIIRLRRANKAASGPIPIPGFTHVATKRTASYELDRYRTPAPVRVTPATLAPVKPSWVAFVQR
jgi:hypothetical protein